jgi:hypothetical protein
MAKKRQISNSSFAARVLRIQVTFWRHTILGEQIVMALDLTSRAA